MILLNSLFLILIATLIKKSYTNESQIHPKSIKNAFWNLIYKLINFWSLSYRLFYRLWPPRVGAPFQFSAVLPAQNAWFSKCIILQWSFCAYRNPILGDSGPTQCTSTSSFWGERGEFVQLGPRWLQNEFQTSFCMSVASYLAGFWIIWSYSLYPKML